MLDLTRPVYVKTQIVDKKNQSTYPVDMERPYNAITIPAEYHTEVYLTNENGKKRPYLPPESILTPPVGAPIIEPASPAPSKKASATPPAVS